MDDTATRTVTNIKIFVFNEMVIGLMEFDQN